MAMLTRLAGSGAVAPGSPKALQRLQNCAALLWPATRRKQCAKDKSTHVDSIDDFTNELVQRKSKKWLAMKNILLKETRAESGLTEAVSGTDHPDAMKRQPLGGGFSQSFGLISQSVMHDLQSLQSPDLGLDIRSLSLAQLDNLIMSTIEIKNKLDFLYLVRQCIRWQTVPSQDVLVSCLKYLCSMSMLQHIDSLTEICRTQEHPLCEIYANLVPFRAMALWKSGGASMALTSLHQAYAKCIATDEGRKLTRAAFRTIAEETLAGKSDAVLVELMEVARKIYEQHNDIFVLACVWKQCFASKWFCDQKLAEDLIQSYDVLQQLVAKRAPNLCSSFLGRNNVDAVHRLIEVFLQNDQKEACSACLRLLFNYQHYHQNLRACAEIVKSCSELNMPLSETQNEQFLNLFILQNDDKNPARKMLKSAPKQLNKFQYKF